MNKTDLETKKFCALKDLTDVMLEEDPSIKQSIVYAGSRDLIEVVLTERLVSYMENNFDNAVQRISQRLVDHENELFFDRNNLEESTEAIRNDYS